VYHRVVNELAAFVLAGGRSTRMGKDKAFLELEGRTLLARALALARSVTSNVRIVGDPTRLAAFGNVIEDVYRNCGPLGGIHAALTNSTAEWNLMLAVDLPFLEEKFLEYLVSAARESKAAVTVPRAAGGFQPLCAVYRRSFAASAGRALRAATNKIDKLFVPTDTRILEQDELLRNRFSSEMFRNINTPKDWDEAKSPAHAKS
jgi:molybdopterin-guanine dinucleotide biosynthesis protein A